MRLIQIASTLITALLLAACSDQDGGASTPNNGHAENAPYVETGDLAQIKQHGRLRIITTRQPEKNTPVSTQDHPQAREQALAQRFARSLGLEPEFIFVEEYSELIPLLLAGKGDLIANNLTVTDSRKQQVAFGTPIRYVHEQLVSRADDSVSEAHDLADRRVAVHASDSYAETLKRLQKRRFQPEFAIEHVAENISTETILHGVAGGRYDLTVADSNLVDALLQNRDDLKVAFDLGAVRPIAWAVRPDAAELLSALNDFLNRHHLTEKQVENYTDDLDAIQKRGVLRVLTRNNAASYFLWRGELLGFEYELMKQFAERHKLKLEMVVPPSHQDLIPWLLEGRGDVIAAAMTISDERSRQGIRFTRPYHEISELLISRSDETGLNEPADLQGRSIVIRESSSYTESLNRLQQDGISFTVQAAPEEMETETIIDHVASGEYDLTVADSHIADIEMTWRDDISSAFPIGEPRYHGWVTRPDNPKLLAALNSFIKKEYRGLFYNITYKKYFKNPKKIRQHVSQRTDGNEQGALSPYDELTRRFAEQYGFDWRMITAQMYQESRFNPDAKSWMGALGLMQVLPRTARALGFKGDLHDAKNGLHAGVRYLSWLMQRFEPELDVGERTWFALAAYNAGIGHVRDARALARSKGWDPDRWFDNVEKAMLLLSRKKYARKAKHGYAHGKETVGYVSRIKDRYRAYLDLTGAE